MENKYFKNIKRAVFFIKRYGAHNPSFVSSYIFNFLNPGYVNRISWYSDQELFEAIYKGVSIIRIGDGEIGLINKGQVPYQEYSPELAYGIASCIREYTENSRYILAIPQFAAYSNKDLKKTKGGVTCWLPLKIMYRKIFNKNVKYMDAHFFYYKNNFDQLINKYLINKKLIINTTPENIKKIEEDNKNLTILEYISAETPHPFRKFLETKKKIEEVVKAYKGDKKDIVVVLSSGPMSKVLAHQLSSDGIQCLDVGHGIEQFQSDLGFQNDI